MSRFKKVFRNIVILAILIFLIFPRAGLFLRPLSAHEHSERSIHYGPSAVVHVEDFDGGKYILGKYDRWVSCNTVNRTLFFFWRLGNQPIGFKNDKTNDISFTYGVSNQDYRVYGIVNDDIITKVEITLANGEVLTQSDFYDDLFLFTWKSSNDAWPIFESIKGYDSEGKIIFEGDSHEASA